MKLNGKQKRYLRSRANRLRPVFSIGKQGLSTQWLNELRNVLNRRELVKVRVLSNAPESVGDVAKVIRARTSIHVVQKIGKTLLLFAVARQDKYRKVSAAVAKV